MLWHMWTLGDMKNDAGAAFLFFVNIQNDGHMKVQKNFTDAKFHETVI